MTVTTVQLAGRLQRLQILLLVLHHTFVGAGNQRAGDLAKRKRVVLIGI